MFEPTDASKCDERQVKKKANSLTNKKKGERHIMSTQGMKTWKLGLFFVMSLMLVVGLFADTAQAQETRTGVTARVTVNTSAAAKSGGTLDTVTVTYIITSIGDEAVETSDNAPDIDANAVVITLPTGWGASLPADTPAFEIAAGVPDEDAATKSYAVVRTNFGLDVTTTPPVVDSSTGKITVTAAAMKRGDSITVVYYNVRVRTFSSNQLGGTITGEDNTETAKLTKAQQDRLGMGQPVVMKDEVSVTDSNTDPDGDTIVITKTGRQEITVTGPKPSTVTITAAHKSVIAEELISALKVSYTVTEDIALADADATNAITIQLPVGWKAAYPPSTDTTGTAADSFGADVLTEAPDLSALPANDPAERMRSYAVVTDPYKDATADTKPALGATLTIGTDNEVTLTFSGNATNATKMTKGDTIALTYHNVRVQSLTEAQLTAGKAVTAQLGVYDTTVGLQHTAPPPEGETGPQIYSLAYKSSGEIMVGPPAKSRVMVTTVPGTVKSEANLRSVRVAYTAQTAVFGDNMITIRLPEGWTPAYRASGSDAASTDMSFGENALSNPPSTGANTTSYVVLKSNRGNLGASEGSNFVIYQPGMNAEVLVAIKDMPRGNTIEATFYGVKVPPLEGEDLAKGSAYAQLVVADSKISPQGTAYKENARIMVHRQTKSAVSVAPSTAKANMELPTVAVTYRVMDMIAGSNMITIELPDIYDQTSIPEQAWGPVYDHTFAPGTIDMIDLGGDATATPAVAAKTMVSSKPADADAAKTSYVTVAYNASGSGRKNTAEVIVSGNEVMVNVKGDMMVNDRVVVTYHNVMAQGIIGTTPVKAMLSAKDKLSPDGMVYDEDAYITVNALATSSVSLSPRTVMAEDTQNITITYVARAAVKANMITIDLPSGWGTAHGTSFMNGMPTAAADRATTSYVTVTPTAENKLSVAGNSVTVDTGDMNRNERLVVKFHNVMVPPFGQIVFSKKADGTQEDFTQLRVTDNITGSEGTDYDATTTITVTALSLGNVSVKPASVEAEDVVSLAVKYTATSTLGPGRIVVELPTKWATANPTIYDKRQPGNSDATYVELSRSGRVKLAKDGTVDRMHTVSGGMVTLDVDAMLATDHITLTFRNLKIAPLDAPRSERYEDIASPGTMNRLQVMVKSRKYSTAADRDSGIPDITAKTLHKDNQVAAKDGGPHPHPTVTVKRKAQGEFAVSPNEVTAGSLKDFTLTYKATKAMKAGDAIEVRLPRSWPSPKIYPLNGKDANVDAKDEKMPHIYLSGSTSRFEGTEVSVIDGNGSDETPGTVNSSGSIVRVALGKDVTRNSSIVLKYNKVTVQRHLTSDANPVLIETFSGPSASVGELPQFPVIKQTDDKITVKHAANGSGKVTFEFGSGLVKPLAKGVNANTNESIPAGTVKDDEHSLRVIYTPDGDMGAGEFEIRLPSDWNAAEVLTSLDDNPKVNKAGDKITTVTAALPALFGESASDRLVLTFTNITVPKTHGNQAFVARSKQTGGSLTQLSPRPMAFVGNTMADHDAVAVKITPKEAYQNQENVDFVITITANGPMHDSKIQILVPEGLTGLQIDDAAKANYVKTTATVGGVMVKTFDTDGETINIGTAQLNAGGKITVRLDNVDLENVSATDPETGAGGFRVETKTRGSQADLSDVSYFAIEKSDGKRSIDGGLIRTVKGSGTMAVQPNLFKQGARARNITLTFTATTDLPEGGLNLVITAPSFIATDLAENTHVPQAAASKFHKDVKAEDRLVVSGNTITWKNIVLRKGEKFVTQINRVNLREETGVDRWGVTLGGTPLVSTDNEQMTVFGTSAEDVVFEIVDDAGIVRSSPAYPASSVQSIRFRFTTVNTDIVPGGRLWFSVPGGWTMPSLIDRTSRATVSIVRVNGEPVKDKDDKEVLDATMVPYDGDKKGEKLQLSVSGRQVIVTVGSKGRLKEGDSVTVRYGDAPDPMKYPVRISASATGTPASDTDGLAIPGLYRTSSEAGFRQHSAGTIHVDVGNVEDATGTVILTTSPSQVRAGSTNNRVAVVYTGTGTMNTGAVRLTIPDGWGKLQTNTLKRNHIAVTVTGSGAVLASPAFEIVGGEGMMVEAYLKTFGKNNTLTFTYGGGTGSSDNRGAEAQAEIGEATFIVESKGKSDGDFVPITDADSLKMLTIKVEGAASGSGDFEGTVMKNKAGEVTYNGVMERRIFTGDDETHLEFTYTAKQAIEDGELRFIVPMGWSAPQDEDSNKEGYTLVDQGNATINLAKPQGQSVIVTGVNMRPGDVIKIQYGWYDTQDGGAQVPRMAGTYKFQLEFDGAAVDDPPLFIVYGGTASKLMVDAPSTVSVDSGADPVTVTVEIQDDRDMAAIVDSALEVTLSSTSSTGSFTDAAGTVIANNRVTIPAGMTQATVHYSDTTVGTATITASATGLASGQDTIEATSDVDRVDENSISVSSATAKEGDTVTVTASGTAGRTATFSVGGVVTDGTMTESPANSGSYSGSFMVVVQSHDGTNMDVTVTIGDASDTLAGAITIDTSAPTISASASPMTVANGGMVTITAMATGATSVTADVSALDTTQTTVPLTMVNGAYSASITISDSNETLNGAKTITVTAMDAAGNSATATAMVTLDNKLSYTSMIPRGQSLFHVPLAVEGLDTIGDLKAALGDAVNLAIVYDHAVSDWISRSDDVPITAGLGILLTMSAAVTHTFEGQAWGDGASTISLKSGSNNLIGLPVNDARVTNVSDIMTLFAPGVVVSITVSTGGTPPFAAVTTAGGANDRPVKGGAAYLVTATADAHAAVIGTGWSSAATGAAPVALAGYNVDGQTAALDVSGAVVDEITGLAKEGFRVKVKNLSTKAALSKVTSVEMAEGYNMTFVDLKAGNAARIGDVLEISADSPDPLIGVKPVRHIVTVDDVKNSTLQLENLIAYEIPAETELLRNYPNPFNPETWIPYHLAEDADVTLRIYALSGELVRTIDVGHQTAAKYDTRSKAVYWDGRNRFGEQVASGVYFYSLSAGDFSATRKMVILK